jgi:AraC-like DNA-binding protein
MAVVRSRALEYTVLERKTECRQLQYAKLAKLFRAQAMIREGKNASEARYMVGHNSRAQFSREYRRHFGYSPSVTLQESPGVAAVCECDGDATGVLR